MTLRDSKWNPKACNLAISRSCFRQMPLKYQLGLRHKLYFYHKLLSFSQSWLRDSVEHYSSFERHTGVKKRNYKSVHTSGHIRVFINFWKIWEDASWSIVRFHSLTIFFWVRSIAAFLKSLGKISSVGLHLIFLFGKSTMRLIFFVDISLSCVGFLCQIF